MPANQGWIKLHRQIRDSVVYQDPNPFILKVWLECLLCATHTETVIFRNGEEIILAPGEYLYSRTSWAKRLGIPKSTLRNLNKKLEKWDMIQDKGKNSGLATIYKIKKWEEYQYEDTLQDNVQDKRRTKLGQSKDTFKNDNNVRMQDTPLTPQGGNVQQNIKQSKLTFNDYGFEFDPKSMTPKMREAYEHAVIHFAEHTEYPDPVSGTWQYDQFMEKSEDSRNRTLMGRKLLRNQEIGRRLESVEQGKMTIEGVLIEPKK